MENKLLTLLVLHLGLAAVVAQPVITTQPQDQNAVAGGSVTFSCEATGTPPLTYQWRRYTNTIRFADLRGETSTTLVLTNVQPTSLRFAVVVTDGGSLAVTSSLARLTVFAISQQPSNQSVSLGANVQFLVKVQNSHPPIQYQWQFSGTNLANRTNATLNLTNVTLLDGGDYNVSASDTIGSLTSRVAHLEIDPTFSKVNAGPVGTDAGYSFTCAWADYDNDGWQDLFVSNGYYPPSGELQQNVLYRNKGDGTFLKTTNAITTTPGYSIGAAWADLDNDGWVDLFVANSSEQPPFIFAGAGNGGFTRITQGSIVTDRGVMHGGAWGDYDHDGLVDLFIVNFKTSDQAPNVVPPPNVLFHNLGDRKFAKIVFESKTADTGSSSGATWCDFDNDGDLDLLVTNGGHISNQRNDLYRNDGNGEFTRLTNAVPALEGGHWVSSAWGDYDNDGYADLFITAIDGGTNVLYRNNGDGTFTRSTNGPVAKEAADSFGCAWADYDDDGYLDLFVANGEYSLQKNFLYHNNGDGTFSAITSGSLVNDLGASAGCAWGDYDNDGFLDLFVSNYFGTSGQPPQRNFLYRNNGNSNSWINIKLVGTVSNRSAIGAKVRVKATIRGRAMWQLREVSGGSGFASQNDLRANFGLGDATSVETMRISWPSGTMQEFHNLAAKQFLTITEPSRLTATSVGGQPQFALKGGRNMTYDIQTSTNLADWAPGSPVTITNFNGTELIPMPMPQEVRQKFYRAVLR